MTTHRGARPPALRTTHIAKRAEKGIEGGVGGRKARQGASASLGSPGDGKEPCAYGRHSIPTRNAAQFKPSYAPRRITGFHRIRHYGFFANGQRRAQLATARALLNVSPVDEDTDHRDGDEHTPPLRLTCPACGQAMNVIECLPPTPRHRGGDAPRD